MPFFGSFFGHAKNEQSGSKKFEAEQLPQELRNPFLNSFKENPVLFRIFLFFQSLINQPGPFLASDLIKKRYLFLTN